MILPLSTSSGLLPAAHPIIGTCNSVTLKSVDSIRKKIVNPSCVETAGIGFAAARIRALIVRNDVLDRITRINRPDQFPQRIDLRAGKRVDAIIQIDQLNPDREIVYACTPISHS